MTDENIIGYECLHISMFICFRFLDLERYQGGRERVRVGGRESHREREREGGKGRQWEGGREREGREG